MVGIGDGMYAGVVTITPEMAARALALTGDLWRSLRERKVEDFAFQMREGAWRTDGSTVRFGKMGELLDGQHRLHAALRAEEPFTTVVVHGDIEQHPMVDTGIPRTLVDWLRHEGHASCSDLAAVIRLHYSWLKEGNVMRAKQMTAPSYETLLEMFKEHTGLNDSIAFGKKISARQCMRGLMPRSWISHLHYLLVTEGGDEEMATEFWHTVSDDTKQEVTPTLFRMVMLRMYESTKRSGVMKVPVLYYALCIKAWNAWITDAPIKNLRYRAFGENKEQFPKILRVDLGDASAEAS